LDERTRSADRAAGDRAVSEGTPSGDEGISSGDGLWHGVAALPVGCFAALA
jgi:hypothetical protein